MEQKDNKNKIDKESSLYCDFGGFKGFSFQKNIDSINKLYFGLGLTISDIPYVFRDESDGKYYLSAYCFSIKSSNENITKEIYYPESFLNLVFYHNNLIFFVNTNNELSIFKFDKNLYTNYRFTPIYPKKNQEVEELSKLKGQKLVKIGDDKIKIISDKLEKIGKDSNLKSTYEMLCDILKNDLGEKLMENSKQFKSKIAYSIKHENMEFTCELLKDSHEIDSIGHLREPINVMEGEVSFQTGIEYLKKYSDPKYKKGAEDKDYIAEDFKCPILYKNFKDKIVPENKAILCEIKGGFAIRDVSNQIEKRINFIKNCLFKKGEKPSYFIGIVNFASENFEKLSNYLGYEPKFEENVLIISIVDYQYHGLDISYEINNKYLLFKKIDKMENKLDGIEKDMKNMKAEMTDNFNEINKKLDILLNQMKRFHPELNIQEDKPKYSHEEEKNNDINDLI